MAAPAVGAAEAAELAQKIADQDQQQAVAQRLRAPAQAPEASVPAFHAAYCPFQVCRPPCPVSRVQTAAVLSLLF